MYVLFHRESLAVRGGGGDARRLLCVTPAAATGDPPIPSGRPAARAGPADVPTARGRPLQIAQGAGSLWPPTSITLTLGWCRPYSRWWVGRGARLGTTLRVRWTGSCYLHPLSDVVRHKGQARPGASSRPARRSRARRPGSAGAQPLSISSARLAVPVRPRCKSPGESGDVICRGGRCPKTLTKTD